MLDVHDTGSSWRVMRVAGKLEISATVNGWTYITRDQDYQELWRLEYPNFDSMPERTRVGVGWLRMCAVAEKIEGVGQRASKNTYWLKENQELLEEYGDVV